jgi:hypothetical protein
MTLAAFASASTTIGGIGAWAEFVADLVGRPGRARRLVRHLVTIAAAAALRA